MSQFSYDCLQNFIKEKNLQILKEFIEQKISIKILKPYETRKQAKDYANLDDEQHSN